jgi:hypothetical protein
MNQKTKTTLILAVLIFISLGLFAQLTVAKKEKEHPKFPKWVSEKGYWVVESNLNSPGKHTIWFYTNDNELMYKEKLEGVKLNAESRRVKLKLKKALETSAIAWERSKNDVSREPSLSKTSQL